ncbi:hypothetical protein [Streptomyces flaveolus]|uniref:hypothetical protein n=1 Tax=Streptomyces flaveolus TaxID=67297 RepID=UPI0036F6D0BC
MQNLTVDPEALKKATEPLGRLAEKVLLAFKKTGQRLDAMGKGYGNDKFGKQFAAKYEPSAHGVVDGGTRVGKVLSDSKDGLKDMADLFQAADDGARKTTADLNRHVNGTPNSGGGRKG